MGIGQVELLLSRVKLPVVQGAKSTFSGHVLSWSDVI